MEDSVKIILQEIHDIFIELGFTDIQINGINMFKYNNCYYKITYVDEYKSIVIETAETYEEAKNGVMEDDDWYDLTDKNVLSEITNELICYYM